MAESREGQMDSMAEGSAKTVEEIERDLAEAAKRETGYISELDMAENPKQFDLETVTVAANMGCIDRNAIDKSKASGNEKRMLHLLLEDALRIRKLEALLEHNGIEKPM